MSSSREINIGSPTCTSPSALLSPRPKWNKIIFQNEDDSGAKSSLPFMHTQQQILAPLPPPQAQPNNRESARSVDNKEALQRSITTDIDLFGYGDADEMTFADANKTLAKPFEMSDESSAKMEELTGPSLIDAPALLLKGSTVKEPGNRDSKTPAIAMNSGMSDAIFGPSSLWIDPLVGASTMQSTMDVPSTMPTPGRTTHLSTDWKVVGGPPQSSKLHEALGLFGLEDQTSLSLATERSSPEFDHLSTPCRTGRPRSASMIERPTISSNQKVVSFVNLDHLGGNIEETSNNPEPSFSGNGSPTIDFAGGQVAQLPTTLHEELGVENAEEATEVFKRSSMDSLNEIPISLTASNMNNNCCGPSSESNPSSSPPASYTPSSTTTPDPTVSHKVANANGVFPSGLAFGPSSSIFGLERAFLDPNPELISRHHRNSWLGLPDWTPIETMEGNQGRIREPISNFSGQYSGRSRPSAKSTFGGSGHVMYNRQGSLLTSQAGSFISNKPNVTFEDDLVDEYDGEEDGNRSDENANLVEEYFMSQAEKMVSARRRHGRRHSMADSSLLMYGLEDDLAGLSISTGAPLNAGSSPFIHGYNRRDSSPYLGSPMASPMGEYGHSFGHHHHQQHHSHYSSHHGHNDYTSDRPGYSGSMADVTFQLSTYKGPLYAVEFKAGRTEIFYSLEIDGKPQIRVRVGELVIVEADRGEDLGKVTAEISVGRLRQLVAGGGDVVGSVATSAGADDAISPELSQLLSSKEIIPKRIHRLAHPSDLKLLQAKAQEEAIAMVRCQSRIRQKKLPMDVVDAEYQWDRNKLTFFFCAERRIDFRELVRDLFRIYKTRIWMCAVDRNSPRMLAYLKENGASAYGYSPGAIANLGLQNYLPNASFKCSSLHQDAFPPLYGEDDLNAGGGAVTEEDLFEDPLDDEEEEDNAKLNHGGGRKVL